MEKKLYRIPEQAVFGGVASGIAQYFRIDIVIVRVVLVIMLLLPMIPPGFGMTGFIYIILWAVLPTGPAITSTDRDNQPYSWDGTILDNPKSEKSVMILGGVLVAFGIIMLVDDFPFWYQIKKYFWPVALIAIGAFIILRQRDKKVENESTGYTPTEPPVKPVEPDPYTPYSTVKPENTHSTDPEVKRKDDEDDQIIRVN